MNRKIMITGGAGFIGSHLVDRFIELGFRVLIVDNLITGKEENLHPEAEFVRMDILDPDLPRVLIGYRPDAVYHMAAQVSVASSIENPLLDAKTNILGALSVMEACKVGGVRKIIYSSSAAVYGIPQSPCISENHGVKPLSFYGISKHAPEHYAAVYRELFGLDFTVLRFANVYGGRQDAQGEGGVVSIFSTMLMAGERPAIYGTGEQTRDYIYVKDVVEACVAALDFGGGQRLNVSTNKETSVNDLLREMCSLCGKPFDPRYAPERPGDIPHSVLDNRLAVRELNWQPAFSLRRGLSETLEYYERRATAGR